MLEVTPEGEVVATAAEALSPAAAAAIGRCCSIRLAGLQVVIVGADQGLRGRGLFSLFLLRAARFLLLLRLLLWSIVVERIILSN